MDCTNTEKLINNQAGKRKDFILLALLTKLHLECLKLLQENNRLKFPIKQEEYLLEKIKDQVSSLKSELRQLDAEHLKFIQLALDDYKNSDNVRFNRYLTEYLVSSYQKISKNISSKETPLEFKNEKETKKGKILEKWKKTIYEFNNDNKINKNNLEKMILGRLEMYFYAKRNVDSLNKVYVAINSFEKFSKQKGTIVEKRLVTQTILQKVGEFLKSTSDTPNLSKEIRESLEKKGLPVKLFTNLRDQLMHHQLFLLKVDNGIIDKLRDEVFNPMKIIIADRIYEINKNFIQSLSKEITDEKIRNNVDSYTKKSVIDLIQYIKEIKNIKIDNQPLAANNKILIDVIYEYALSIKSENIPSMSDSATNFLNDKKSKILSTIEASLQKSRFKISEDINKELASWKLSLDQYSSDVSKIDKVVGYLEGDIPFDSEKKKEVETDLNNLLKKFDVLDKIKVYDQKVSLKKQLEEYLDLEGFKNKDYFSKKTKIDDLINVLNSAKNKNDKLKNFLNASKVGASYNSLKPEVYEELVKELQLSKKSEEKLLSYSVEWRKNKCIDLLKNNPLAFKIIRDAIAEAKDIPYKIFENLAYQYKPKNEDELKTEEKAKNLQKSITDKVKDFYLKITSEMITDLKSFSQYHAVHMQFTRIYSILEKLKENTDDTFMIRQLRNHLVHEKQNEIFKEQFIKLIKEAVNKIDSSKEITIFTLNKAVSDLQFILKFSEIDKIVSSKKITGFGSQILNNNLYDYRETESRSRTRRSINNSLFPKEDVEKFSKNLVQKSKQQRRRHLPEAHVDYLSRKPLAIDLIDQPRVELSNATIPSSWINGVVNWAKNSISGLFSSIAVSSGETLFTTNSNVQVNPRLDVDNCLILLDFFARKLTGQMYVSTVNHVTSAQEAESCAINIIDGFRKIVEQAALKCDIKMHRFNFNFEKMQEEVAGKIIGDKLDEISTVIKTHVEKASPGREAGCIGRLSQKKFNKFMIDFNSRLNIILHQEIQSIVSPEKTRLGVSDETKNSQTKNYLKISSAKAPWISDRVLKLE